VVYAAERDGHPLRRDIVTTLVVNDMVNRGGTTFLFRMNEETGASVPDMSRAWLVARECYDMPEFWAQVESLDGQVSVATQISLLLEGRKLTERAVRWLLANRRPPFDIQATIGFFADGVRAVGASLPKLLTGRDLATFTERQETAITREVPADLAERVASMVPAYSAFDIVNVAADTGSDVTETAAIYFSLGGRLQIARLRDQIVALPRDDRWNTMARGTLRDDLYAAHAALVCDVLKVTGPGTPEERLAQWADRNEEAVQRTGQTLTEIWETERSTLATLSVAVRAVRSLVASGASPVHS
jgi:glutamate dehydrogenase